MGFFQDLFGQTAAKANQTAANQRVAGLNTGLAQETPYYNQAVGAVNTGYTGAQDVVNPILSSATSGANAYGDITGANGPEGQARAQALFQTDPGYQFIMNQALQQTARAAGTGGFQNSGNVQTALQDRAAGVAAQQYGNYVSRLAPYLQQQTSLAPLAAGLYTGQGSDLASLYGGQGNLTYNTATGVGNAQAAGTLGAAQAQTAAAGNIANLGTKLLGYAMAPATGGASLLSTLGGGNEFGVSDDELYGVGARALQA
jgi:hypothetical protein